MAGGPAETAGAELACFAKEPLGWLLKGRRPSQPIKKKAERNARPFKESQDPRIGADSAQPTQENATPTRWT